MLLPPVRLDLLVKVAVLVQQPDTDERQTEITRRLARVAGQHAETAAVGVNALVQTVLAREIRDGTGVEVGMILREPRVLAGVHVLIELTDHRPVLAHERLVLDERPPALRL